MRRPSSPSSHASSRDRSSLPRCLLALDDLALQQQLFVSAYGEFPAFALVGAGLVLVTCAGVRRRGAGALLLGLAILTKSAVGIGLLLPGVFLVATGREGKHPGVLRIMLLALIVAPVIVWRFVIPVLALDRAQHDAYAQAARARSGFERDLAFGDFIDAAHLLVSSGGPSEPIRTSFLHKKAALEWFWGPGARAFALIAAAILATTWCLTSTRPVDRTAGLVGLYGLGTLAWWLLANRLAWYRHLFPATLAFYVVVVHATVAIPTKDGFGTRALRLLASALLFATALCAAVAGRAPADAAARMLEEGALDKRVTLELAELIRGLVPTGAALYTIGWYQAPQVQLLSSNVFRDVLATWQVVHDIDAGREPYFVFTPQTQAFEASGDTVVSRLRAATLATSFDEAGYALWKLDPARLRSTVCDLPATARD